MKSDITAKNYASDAAEYLSKIVKQLDKDEFKTDIIMANQIIKDLKESIHFVMPDGGSILNDNLKGIADMKIRLPYPKISVEYYIKENDSCFDSHFGYSPKRVIIAKEVPTAIINERIPVPNELKDFEHIILMSSLFFSQKANDWMPSIIGFLIPCQWDFGKEKLLNRREYKNMPAFTSASVPMFPDFFRHAVKGSNGKEKLRMLEVDLTQEVKVLLELIEALSCSNVKESIHQEASKKNAQRIKSHKKPIWETKFLTLVVNEKQDKRIKDSMTSHASPRQHLRRGHIRRLPSKNIWVNSCVVGNIENGKVEKQYKLRK